MQKRLFIQDITPNTEISGLFLIAASSQSQSRNGPFWRLELKDASGSIEAKIWNPLSQQFSELPMGSIVDIDGRASLYREKVEATISRLRILSADETAALDLSLFMRASARPATELYNELLNLAKKELRHKPWRKFALSVLQDEAVVPLLLAAPAAKNVHHAYAGGLLEHTLSVARLCLDFAAHYPEMDKETLLCAAMFHDLGKIWELTGGLANDYSDVGRLIGHIELALSYLTPKLERCGVEAGLALHFRHIILSHHGEYEYGSPRRPKTAEAFALHYADNLDAKIAQSRTALSGIDDGEQGWSPWQGTLQRVLYQPCRTQRAVDEPQSKAAGKRRNSRDTAGHDNTREKWLALPGLEDVVETLQAQPAPVENELPDPEAVAPKVQEAAPNAAQLPFWKEI